MFDDLVEFRMNEKGKRWDEITPIVLDLTGLKVTPDQIAEAIHQGMEGVQVRWNYAGVAGNLYQGHYTD